MKVIGLVLFILTSIAAQENKKYYVLLRSQIGPETIRAGYLVLTQYGPENPVQIDATIERLPSGWHRFEVHEINENTTNCDSLGPMVDLGFDTLFDLLDEYIYGRGTRHFTKVTRSLTLEPNEPRTLIGRAIAFSQEPMLDVIASEQSDLSVACGSVLTAREFMQKRRYYMQKIARDPKFTAAHIWY